MSHDPSQQDESEGLSEVNVIPLADLSLVLLIILMVLSPMIMQSMIKVQNSSAAPQKKNVSKPEPPLILDVYPDKVILNSVTITNDLDLAAKLSAAIENREDKTLLLTVQSTTPHGRFVQVLDLVKQKGADKIALLRHKGDKGSAPIAVPPPPAAK